MEPICGQVHNMFMDFSIYQHREFRLNYLLMYKGKKFFPAVDYREMLTKYKVFVIFKHLSAISSSF